MVAQRNHALREGIGCYISKNHWFLGSARSEPGSGQPFYHCPGAGSYRYHGIITASLAYNRALVQLTWLVWRRSIMPFAFLGLRESDLVYSATAASDLNLQSAKIEPAASLGFIAICSRCSSETGSREG